MEQIAISADLRRLVLRMLTAKQSVADILDALCGAAGIQILLLDEGARLLAHSRQILQGDPLWVQILEDGGIPYRYFLEQPQMLSELWRLMKTRRPIRPTPIPGQNLQFIFAPMVLADAFAGYVFACANPDFDAALLQDIAVLVGRVYLHKCKPAERPIGFVDDFFMTAIAWELLASDSASVSELALQYHKWSGASWDGPYLPAPRPPFLIAALCGAFGSQNREQLAKTGRLLRDRIPNLFFLAVDSVLLVCFMEVSDRKEYKLIETLRAFAADSGSLCGLSRRFDALQERKYYKAQAMDALQLGKGRSSQARIFPAQDLYPDLLLKAAADRLTPRALWRTDLETLAEHDKQNGTAYLETLEQYLLSGNNHTRAANKLFVDRSTLNYRLAKIKSLTGCDLDNPEVAHRLLIAIRVHGMAL